MERWRRDLWIFELVLRKGLGRWREGGPRSPRDEWRCKNIYLKHNTVGHEQRGEEEKEEEGRQVLPSFQFPLSLSHHFLLPCFPSDKVGQHYTSVQHAGGERFKLRERWMGVMGRGKRECKKKGMLQREKGNVDRKRCICGSVRKRGDGENRRNKEERTRSKWLIYLYVSVGHLQPGSGSCWP